MVVEGLSAIGVLTLLIRWFEAIDLRDVLYCKLIVAFLVINTAVIDWRKAVNGTTTCSNAVWIGPAADCGVCVEHFDFNRASWAPFGSDPRRLYSLSDGVSPLLRELDEPVRLDFYTKEEC